MKKISTSLRGLFILETINFKDSRGSFQKLFNKEFFNENGLDSDFCEFYFSVNKKGVIRGMHFQLPPFDHTKLVYVSRGKILDVVVDIRKDSLTFGKYFSIELNESEGKYLYIPKGFAHGFASLEDGSIVNYAQTSCYSSLHDSGIDRNSFGFEWPFENPIVSGRDLTFKKIGEFNTPF